MEKQSNRPVARALAAVVGAGVSLLLGACASQNSGGGAGSSLPGASLPDPPSLPPPSSSPSSASSIPEPDDGTSDKSGSAATGAAQTAEERRAAIDGRLDATLGNFDEQLRREQERVAKERDARAAGAPASNQGGAGSEAEERERRAARARAGDLKSDRGAADAAAQSANGNSGPKVGGGGADAGRAIPDGNDDDIIARRLRKAAETETDPELKEKLWKEYVDYKANLGK